MTRVDHPVLVVKIGGSVLTESRQRRVGVRKSALVHIAMDVASLLQTGYQCVIIHGAGLIGHPMAAEYDLIHGLNHEGALMALARTSNAMSSFNAQLVDILHSKSIPAVGMSPHTLATVSHGKLRAFRDAAVAQFMEIGCVPVLYGDVVVDQQQGCSILSGDVTCCHLARRLGADLAVFLSDVDGVYDSDPKIHGDAKLISSIRRDQVGPVADFGGSPQRVNVTGEMRGKIECILGEPLSCDAVIANGFRREVLRAVVAGEQLGTRIPGLSS